MIKRFTSWWLTPVLLFGVLNILSGALQLNVLLLIEFVVWLGIILNLAIVEWPLQHERPCSCVVHQALEARL
ncbi:MAG: hypothetical protein V3U76_04015 [Granulosicoccus sp.]